MASEYSQIWIGGLSIMHRAIFSFAGQQRWTSDDQPPFDEVQSLTSGSSRHRWCERFWSSNLFWNVLNRFENLETEQHADDALSTMSFIDNWHGRFALKQVSISWIVINWRNLRALFACCKQATRNSVSFGGIRVAFDCSISAAEKQSTFVCLFVLSLSLSLSLSLARQGWETISGFLTLGDRRSDSFSLLEKKVLKLFRRLKRWLRVKRFQGAAYRSPRQHYTESINLNALRLITGRFGGEKEGAFSLPHYQVLKNNTLFQRGRECVG